jgi:hypothetical protein
MGPGWSLLRILCNFPGRNGWWWHRKPREGHVMRHPYRNAGLAVGLVLLFGFAFPWLQHNQERTGTQFNHSLCVASRHSNC